MNYSNLLVIAFIIKLLSRKNIFNNIREKEGIVTLRQCRQLEKCSWKLVKVNLDLNFLLKCKKEKLVPTFARPKLAINADRKLRWKIASVIIKSELRNKHNIRKSLLKKIQEFNELIQSKLWFVKWHALKHRIRKNTFEKKKKCVVVHQKKLERLRSEGNITNNTDSSNLGNKVKSNALVPNIIHNFSSYNLSDKETQLLSYTLDHYVPYKSKNKRVQVEFERFYKSLISHNSINLNEHDKLLLKTNCLDAFSKYSKIRVDSEDKEIIEKLHKNKDITILKQDKGRGVVILNKSDYISKCGNFLGGEQFEKLSYDPTKRFQAKVQSTLLKMKKKFDQRTYKRLYPSSSQPGLFFGLAKMHKLENASYEVGNLPLRPVISNIGTSTYEISKYLAKLLVPLTKGVYNIESTTDFLSKLKTAKIEPGYKMVSLDVVSLFTSVPLDSTIELILDKIYKENKVSTKFSRKELKTLLELCTKCMHFSFNDDIYRQVNGVAMGSPLGPVLANIFMVELEDSLVPLLSEKMKMWYRYVDDTFTFIKVGEIESVEGILNAFHSDIKFTHDVEKNDELSFLDVKVMRNVDGTFETDVYRKKTDNSIYINWNSYAPKMWKIGTLKGLVRRAHLICSNESLKENELKYLTHVFTKINGYPSKIVYKTFMEMKKKIEDEHSSINANNQNILEDEQIGNQDNASETESNPYICLPYSGKKGEKIVNKFKSQLRNVLPKEVKPRIIFNGKKLGSFFSCKDKVKKEHLSDLVYGFKPTNTNQLEYIGETRVRFGARIHEHAVTDKNSAIYRNSNLGNHEVTERDFIIMEKNYKNIVNRKIAEALFIKEKKPPLNEQIMSYKLQLFN